MSNLLKIDDSGTRQFQIGNGPVFTVDLYAVFNEWRSIAEEHDNGRGADLPHYVAMIERLGGGKVSQKAAMAFVDLVVQEVSRELEKKAPESMPCSAESMASTVSI